MIKSKYVICSITLIGLEIPPLQNVFQRLTIKAFNLGLFDSYYVTALPAKINIVEISLIVIVSLIVCALASIYPALKAANSLPVEGLKYD